MAYLRNPLQQHLSDVQIVIAHGVPVSHAWLTLRENWIEYVESQYGMRDRLVEAVRTGADIAAAKAAALAVQTANSVDEAELTGVVGAAVLGDLTNIYRPAALKNYRTVATEFDQAAKRFTDACKLVDVEAAGDTLLRAPQQQRDAWFAAPELAEQLDAFLWVLPAVARLAGATEDMELEHRLQLGLCVDPAKAHRRRVAEIWQDRRLDGRTGRWGRLVALGAKLRPATDPTDALYPELPDYVKALDAGRVIRRHDPLDGKLPKGWSPTLDGWANDDLTAFSR